MPLLLSAPATPLGYQPSSTRPSNWTPTETRSNPHASWDRRLNKPSPIPSWTLPVPRSSSSRSLPIKAGSLTSNPPRSPFLPDRYDEDDPPSGTDSAGSTFSDVEPSPISPPRSRGSFEAPELSEKDAVRAWPLAEASAAAVSFDDEEDEEYRMLANAVIEEVVRVINYHPVLARNVKPRLVDLPKRRTTTAHSHRAQQSDMVHKPHPPTPAIPRRSSQRRPSSCSVVADLPPHSFPHHPQYAPPAVPGSTLRGALPPLTRSASKASRHSVCLERPLPMTIQTAHQMQRGHAETAVMRPEFQTFISRGAASLLRPTLAGASRRRQQPSPSLELRTEEDGLIRVTSDITVSTVSTLGETEKAQQSPAARLFGVRTSSARQQHHLPQGGLLAETRPRPHAVARSEATRKITLTPSLLLDSDENDAASVRSLSSAGSAPRTHSASTVPSRGWGRHHHQRTNTDDSVSSGPTSHPVSHRKTPSTASASSSSATAKLKGLKSTFNLSPLTDADDKLARERDREAKRVKASITRKPVGSGVGRRDSRRSLRHTSSVKGARMSMRPRERAREPPLEVAAWELDDSYARELSDLDGRIGC